MTILPRISGQALSVENDAILAEAMAQTLTDLGRDNMQTCRSTGETTAELARQAIESPPILMLAPG